MELAGENVGMNDTIIRGHKVNRESVLQLGCTGMGVSKDIWKMNYVIQVWPHFFVIWI